MKVLVTGAKGQLGFDVVRELQKREISYLGFDLDELDITNEEMVNKVLLEHLPDAVIHCAAWTAVDAAEDEENKDKVYRVNVLGTQYLAKACNEIHAKMIYISTDYIFNGLGEKPWSTQDLAEPINYYGKTKYEGELAVQKYLDQYFIVRISWVFGLNGRNFVRTMLDLAKKNGVLSVVDDQIGSPTYTYDLSRLLVDLVVSEKYGIYHATNEGPYISWFEFAREIMKAAAQKDPYYKEVEVKQVSSDAFVTKAKRPKNSRMNRDDIVTNGFDALPDYRDAITRYLEVIEVNHG